ncbi:MAG: AMP-binding protein [Prosthecobacter sp.]|jgi:acyl-[acyl-carrier-protein]-phospholipid O-acyltransferase/long-chain-fatty-acid--[acyl-carrier-protein] ligase|uniref:AMP-binding protein n=1 Tax=Prosthecobacter sp. TaxID=1965333 RepID=UPI0019F2B89C|nr:AMP-binding protein [Prosthecobacter sp.]MBE2287571.1 AMP-binding protein [Prosthecobacter sp.]
MASEKPVTLKDLTILGKDNVPSGGGYLILPSQLGYFDLLRLELVLGGRQVIYLVKKGAALHPLLRVHLEGDNVQAMEFSPGETEISAYQRAMGDAAKTGAVIIYLPAEAAAMPAPMTTIPGTKLEFLLKAGIPVLPLFVHRRQDTAMPIERRYHDSEAVFCFGKLLQGPDVNLATFQETLLLLSEQAFGENPTLDMSLGYALIQGFKKHGSRNSVVDGKDDSVRRFDQVFATALALAQVVKRETKKERVGIILPPGLGGLICNVAVLMAGKIPVNLNFTAGRSAIDSAIRQGQIDRFLTADIFVRKMQSFPWPPMKQLILIERLLPKMKVSIVKWLVLSKILPSALLAAVLGVSKKGGRKEALLLFTSGSSGEPKGVALTHRNIIANVMQFGSRLGMKSTDSILGCLPLFHSFGCTVTLWFPIIYGLHLVTYPTPLEVKKIAQLIEKFRVTLMLATPTFLRGYLRGVNRESLASIKLCVTGAEKLPTTVADAFETRFGKRVLEGYGLTETSPASNLNLPDPDPLGDEESGYSWMPSHRQGSVGHTLPGMAVRITHPETGAPVSLHQSGMIWFKGANVFDGYLNDPKRTADVLQDGWFRTGDIGRVDLDGFLYIEGRLSRFSKIAGEMVPHETVEETLVKAMGLENETVRKIAVVGVPDIDKGEALILLTSMPGGPEHQEILDLRYRLLDKGMPPLWIPKKMIRVSDIPVLASGKLDVQSCEKIARASAGI